jgi:hypothetical protein
MKKDNMCGNLKLILMPFFSFRLFIKFNDKKDKSGICMAMNTAALITAAIWQGASIFWINLKVIPI